MNIAEQLGDEINSKISDAARMLLRADFPFNAEALMDALNEKLGEPQENGRVPRIGNPMYKPSFWLLIERLLTNYDGFKGGFDVDGRILHLKNTGCVSSASALELDIVLVALLINTKVEGLYIQGYQNFKDEQLYLLGGLLKKRRIWGINLGETWRVSKAAWLWLADQLHLTAVGYIYICEIRCVDAATKKRIIDTLGNNRRRDRGQPRDAKVSNKLTLMWWSPPKR